MNSDGLFQTPKALLKKTKNAAFLITGKRWLELSNFNLFDSDRGQQAPAQGGRRQQRTFTFLVKEHWKDPAAHLPRCPTTDRALKRIQGYHKSIRP